MSVNCDVIGEFTEFFRWRVEGKMDELTLCVMGQTIGPQFHFDVDGIDFGTVSYNFLNVAFVELANVCEIPMNFRLRIPEDGTLLHREFDVVPATGTLLPDSTKKIKIEFLSNTCKAYHSHLVVDIVDVGENLLSIPIKANCIVPEVLVSTTKINFGDCFIGYTYSQTLDLGNISNQPAKYEVILPQEEERARYSVDSVRGIVSSNSTHQIKISICTKEVGTIHTPLYVKIIGSERPPFEVYVSACAIGPIVDLDTKVIEWGKVKVLQSHQRSFKIINRSPIMATFKLVFSSPDPEDNVFSCKVEQGVVPPGSEYVVEVLVTPDESMKFIGRLVVSIENGEKTSIELVAFGTGSSIQSSIPLDMVDFENAFTSIPVSKSFMMTNAGRKPQGIQWLQVRKSRGEASDVVFKILPERTIIQPKSSHEFTIHGSTTREGQIAESFICRTSGKTQKQLYEAKVQGTFIVPRTRFSTRALRFEYTHKDDCQPTIQSQSLTITNVSTLPLTMTLKVTGPFSLDTPGCTLPVDSSSDIKVYFDPDYRHDRASADIKSKLTITYMDHPQKDAIDLCGVINFPNIEIQSTTIDFGTTITNTLRQKQLVVSNNGVTDAYFDWSLCLLEDHKMNEHILTVFDIMPIKGVVKAGEKTTIDISFQSRDSGVFECLALCQVSGGPKYEVQLKGETSAVSFTIDSNEIDFGLVPYFSTEQREITLSNTGKVLFSYEFDTTTVTIPNRIELFPSSGRIKANERQKIVLRFLPGVPEEIRENVSLFIGNADPIHLSISAIAVQQCVELSLERENSEVPIDVLQEAESLYQHHRCLSNMAIQRFFPQHKSTSSTDREQAIQQEIDRMLLKQYLQKGSIQKQLRRGTAGSSTPSSRPVTRSVDAKFVMARYVCDFGNVVKGTTRKKAFKVSNTGVIPVSFKFEKKVLASLGLTVEPSEVKKLPGFPSAESQTMEVLLQTKHPTIDTGDFLAIVPMEIVSGYMIELVVKATICIPEITMSCSEIEFGSLYVGFSKVVPIQLHNTTVMSCDWAIEFQQRTQQAVRLTSEKDEGRIFVCKPEQGTLMAGEKVNVEVSFIPTSSKKYTEWLVLRCSGNPKPTKINCTGVGKDVDISISSVDLQFGSLLPYATAEATITVTNNSDLALDFISVEFDERFIKECEQLQAMKDYQSIGYILVPPRTSGDELSDDMFVPKSQSVEASVDEEQAQTLSDDAIPPPHVLQKIFIPHNRKERDMSHISLLSHETLETNEKTSRWNLPPKSSTTILVRFSSTAIGNFDSALHFCVYSRKAYYKVRYRAAVGYPYISTHERALFPRRVKQRLEKMIVMKKYVMSERCFDFGPLLKRGSYTDVSEHPDTVTNNRYHETFTLTNNGLFDAELNCFVKSGSNNFIIEPQSLLIKKDQTGSIKLWGLPKSLGVIRDSIILTIKNNPVPFQFDVQMTGAEPKAVIDRQSVDFGRVLLSTSTVTETLLLKNTCPIPITWKVAESHQLSSEFTIEPTSGRLGVGEKAEIRISFSPKQQNVVKDFLMVSFTDEDQITSSESIKVTVTAESFNLDVKVDSELNFGTIKVMEGVTKTIQLNSSSKLEVEYNFEINKNLKKYFTVTPQSGSLNPKTKGPTLVSVQFKSLTEKKLKNCTDICCVLTDVRTKEEFSRIKLNINVDAVFSKFSISPPQGINFGPVNFDKQKAKQVEISNEGAFPFTVQIFDMKTGQVEEPERPQSKSKKAPVNRKKDSSKKSVTVGQFVAEPCSQEVPPGSKKAINITFNGQESNTFKEVLGIEISGRDTSSHPQGIPYELEGESCIPCMIVNDFYAIFEDQQIVQNFSQMKGSTSGMFGLDDQLFYFGTVAAGKKVEEKIKLMNPGKVPCTIECSLKPRTNSEKANVVVFDVQPQKLFVPPHEHRFVTLYFEPKTLLSYGAIFNATVVDGKDANTNNLKFEVRGDGALPVVSIKQPHVEGSGPLVLKFPKTLVGRKSELPVALENKGLLVATVKFELKAQESIKFPCSGQEIVLNSNETKSFLVSFEPKQVEKIDAQLTIAVLGNNSTVVKIVGEGYVENVTFDDLPNNEESLNFGFCEVNNPKQLTFSLTNHSADHFKYSWTSLPHVSISPLYGHIHSKAVQDITVTVLSPEVLEYKNQSLVVELTKIRYEGKVQEWNERHKSVKWIQVDEEAERRRMEEEKMRMEEEKNKKKSKTQRPKSKSSQRTVLSTQVDENQYEVKLVSRRIEEVNPEPLIQTMQAIPSKTLTISALVDYASFECDCPPLVTFKLTKMFETRKITFTMKNTGRTELRFDWQSVLLSDESPFSMVPRTGAIPPQKEESFALKYSPLDVGDHRAQYNCVIPNTTQQLPSVVLSGTSVCPIVHFQFTPSDYLTSGRRTFTSKGPGGFFGVLDNETKVLEITSFGLKSRNTKKFSILNPTDLSYEFEWQRIENKNESTTSESLFSCSPMQGILHSGKKVEIVFDFIPQSLQSCESYWVFTIPSKKVYVSLLLVGHVSQRVLNRTK